MRSIRVLAFAAVFLAAASASAAETVMVDGVPHVRNAADPARGERVLKLRELWSVGGADDEDNFFGLITEVESDPAGNIFVLDGQLCQVSVYSPDGELIKTLFHEGDGPGEIRQPRDMVMMPDGRVGLVQEFPGKIVFVEADGTPAGSLTPGSEDPTAGGVGALAGAACRGGSMALAGIKTRPGERAGTQDRKLYLASYDPDGTMREYLLSRDTMFDFNNFRMDENVHLASYFWNHAVDGRGRIYAVPSFQEYRVNVYSRDGSLERVIERDFELRRRSGEEKDYMRRLVDGSLRNFPGEYEFKVSEYAPVVAWLQPGLRISGDGDLWIMNSYGNVDQPDGVMVSYDVFGPDGEFEQVVRIACDADGSRDGLFCLGGDRFVIVRGYTDAIAASFGSFSDEDDGQESEPMGITCYELAE